MSGRKCATRRCSLDAENRSASPITSSGASHRMGERYVIISSRATTDAVTANKVTLALLMALAMSATNAGAPVVWHPARSSGGRAAAELRAAVIASFSAVPEKTHRDGYRRNRREAAPRSKRSAERRTCCRCSTARADAWSRRRPGRSASTLIRLCWDTDESGRSLAAGKDFIAMLPLPIRPTAAAAGEACRHRCFRTDQCDGRSGRGDPAALWPRNAGVTAAMPSHTAIPTDYSATARPATIAEPLWLNQSSAQTVIKIWMVQKAILAAQRATVSVDRRGIIHKWGDAVSEVVGASSRPDHR